MTYQNPHGWGWVGEPEPPPCPPDEDEAEWRAAFDRGVAARAENDRRNQEEWDALVETRARQGLVFRDGQFVEEKPEGTSR